MGVDSVFLFELPEPLTAEELAKFNYRLGESLDLTHKDDKAKLYHSETKKYEIRNGWRFYGSGYERGPAIDIIALLKFIKDYFGGDVILYYGGDCHEGLPVWTDKDEQEMWSHFIKYGHAPYGGYNNNNHPCPECNGPMSESGSSFDVTKNERIRHYICPGCEYSTRPKA